MLSACVRLALVATVALSLSPPVIAADPPPPEVFVDALEGTFGTHPGFRRSHAKGVCASGTFVGTAEGRRLSEAALFSGATVPVVARFSVGGGNPKASDKARTVRGLALEFTLPNREQMLMAMISAPVFFVATPENFIGFVQSRTPDPATGRPDPEKVKAFNDAHPDTRPQIEYLRTAPVPASYAEAQYWGINAFRFVTGSDARWVRWTFVPATPGKGLDEQQLQTMPEDFLAAELRSRVGPGKPAEWSMVVQLAEPGDTLTDPTQAWPETRRTVTVGRLSITAVEPGPGGACDAITFDPLILPKGIEPSDDPVLNARSAPYAVSLSRRLQ